MSIAYLSKGQVYDCFSNFDNSFDQISGMECQEGLFGLECVRVEECGFGKSIMRYREEGNDETICNFSNFCESLVFKFGKYILFYFLGIFRNVFQFMQTQKKSGEGISNGGSFVNNKRVRIVGFGSSSPGLGLRSSEFGSDPALGVRALGCGFICPEGRPPVIFGTSIAICPCGGKGVVAKQGGPK